MSKISEQVRNYALEEKRAHEEYIKDFTASTIAHLVNGGVERDKAMGLAKKACLQDEELVHSVNRSLILDKTAAYIEALEQENVELASKLADAEPDHAKRVDGSPNAEHLDKLAAVGF